MHLSSNISHWVCVLMGVVLILTGLASHAPRTTAGIGMQQQGTTADAGGIGKRVVLIAIGLIAVAYGVSRVLA